MIRASAVATLLVSGLSLLLQVALSVQGLAAAGLNLQSLQGMGLLALGFALFGLIAALVYGGFLWMLAREDGEMALPYKVQGWCFYSAIILLALTLTTLPNAWRVVAMWGGATEPKPPVIQVVMVALAALSNLPLVALLAALGRSKGDVPPSGRLATWAQRAAVAWSVIILMMLIRLGSIPFAYSNLAFLARSRGVELHVWDVLWAPTFALLSQLTMFIAPYAVFRASKVAVPGAADEERGESTPQEPTTPEEPTA